MGVGSGDELSLGVLCFVAHRAVETRVLAALARAGYDDVTPSQGRVFSRIAPEGTRIGDLAEQAHVTKQTASALVDHLERRGYVRRVADPRDARATLVIIDERGHQAVEVARIAEAEVEQEWVRQIGATAARQLRAALEGIREVADPYR
jgi:DNA-binding MarR family transcriptional regulator